MIFAEICRANDADACIVADHQIQLLDRIGPVACCSQIEFEDFLLEVVVGLGYVAPGLRCLSEALGLDFEVFESALLALVFVVDCVEVKEVLQVGEIPSSSDRLSSKLGAERSLRPGRFANAILGIAGGTGGSCCCCCCWAFIAGRACTGAVLTRFGGLGA
jgi:hypothetical protein